MSHPILRPALRWSLAMAALAVVLSPVPNLCAQGITLEAQFEDPPNRARPRVWWHWMNGNITEAIYSTAKAAVHEYTRCLAALVRPYDVYANAIAPGFISSAMTQQTAYRIGVSFEEFRANVAAGTPVRRVGEPEDVANAVAFFASDQAGFVTGEIAASRFDPPGPFPMPLTQVQFLFGDIAFTLIEHFDVASQRDGRNDILDPVAVVAAPP